MLIASSEYLKLWAEWIKTEEGSRYVGWSEDYQNLLLRAKGEEWCMCRTIERLQAANAALRTELAGAVATAQRMTLERDAVAGLCYHPDETAKGTWYFYLSCEMLPDQKRQYRTEDQARAAVFLSAGIFHPAIAGEGG